MKNTLLGVIAVCLFMITLKLYIPEANAEVAGLDYYDLRNDYDFKKAVKSITKQTIKDECRVMKRGTSARYTITLECK